MKHLISLIKQKIPLALIAIVVSIVTPLSILVPTASALNNPGYSGVAANMSPTQQAKAYAYYKYLRTCFSYNQYSSKVGFEINNWISIENANQFNWFWSGGGLKAKAGIVNAGDIADAGNEDNVQDCHGDSFKKVMSLAAPLFGYTGAIAGSQILCDLGFTPEVGGTCARADTGWRYNIPGNITGKVDDWFKNKLGFGSVDLSGLEKNGGAYALYLNSFTEYCAVQDDSGGYKNVLVFTPPSATPAQKNYRQNNPNHKPDSLVNLYEGGVIRCDDLAKKLADKNDSAIIGMATWITNNPEKKDEESPNACTDNPNSDACKAAVETKSSCIIDGVGWIVCSMANFLASVTDSIYGLIEQMLRIPVINTNTTSGTNGVYNAWSIMLSIANVAFVIVFLIIIFSQLTGLGISNYGVKKTLPRLVVAAILVNASFWISAIAVDISNILGASIYDLLSGVKDRMNIGGISANWGSIVTLLLSGAGIAMTSAGIVSVAALGAVAVASTPGGMMAIVFLVLPVILGAVLAVLILVFVLIARQAIVTILIIAAPLAFVAMLLPNTQRWFTKWRQTLMSLLLMYPIISLIFGGAQIAGLAILSSAALNSSAGPEQVITGALAIVTGQLIMVIPFFFLPTLIKKFSGANIDSMAAKISAKGQRALSGVSKLSRSAGRQGLNRTWNRMKYGNNTSKRGGRVGDFIRGAGAAAGSIGARYDQYLDKNAMSDDFLKKEHGSATQDRLVTDPNFALAVAGGDAVKAGQIRDRAIAAKREEELKVSASTLASELAMVKNGTHPSFSGTNTDSFLEARATSTAHSAIDQEAAMNELARQGRSKVIRKLEEPGSTANQEALQRAIAASGGALAGKAPDILKGASAAFENIKGKDLAGYSTDTAEAHGEFLAKLHAERASLTAVASAPGATQADIEAANKATASYQNATTSFISAIEDLRRTPALQAEFGGDTGREYLNVIANLDPAIQADISAATNRIDSTTGKVR